MSDRQIEALQEAIREAERFVERAYAAVNKLKEHNMWFPSSKETAAAKRASMDLTRALVKVRNPYHDS